MDSPSAKPASLARRCRSIAMPRSAIAVKSARRSTASAGRACSPTPSPDHFPHPESHMLTGYTANLPSDVLLDSGVLYVGSTPIGVTRGVPEFNPNKEVENVDFDG